MIFTSEKKFLRTVTPACLNSFLRTVMTFTIKFSHSGNISIYTYEFCSIFSDFYIINPFIRIVFGTLYTIRTLSTKKRSWIIQLNISIGLYRTYPPTHAEIRSKEEWTSHFHLFTPKSFKQNWWKWLLVVSHWRLGLLMHIVYPVDTCPLHLASRLFCIAAIVFETWLHIIPFRAFNVKNNE